jgi:hypothetical protein
MNRSSQLRSCANARVTTLGAHHTDCFLFVEPQVASVDQVLQVSTPAFLDSVRTLRPLEPVKSLKLMLPFPV